MLLTVLLQVGGACALAGPGAPDGPPSLRVFYFGNGLTGCTNPQWHGQLGKSAGKEWVAEAFPYARKRPPGAHIGTTRHIDAATDPQTPPQDFDPGQTSPPEPPNR